MAIERAPGNEQRRQQARAMMRVALRQWTEVLEDLESGRYGAADRGAKELLTFVDEVRIAIKPDVVHEGLAAAMRGKKNG